MHARDDHDDETVTKKSKAVHSTVQNVYKKNSNHISTWQLNLMNKKSAHRFRLIKTVNCMCLCACVCENQTIEKEIDGGKMKNVPRQHTHTHNISSRASKNCT